MCGRSCLTLNTEEIQCSCIYKTGSSLDEIPRKPIFRNVNNCGRAYQPSFNIAPTDISPVLISSAHLSKSTDGKNERILIPMLWGLIPYWHKGDPTKHKLSTNNCRLEGLSESKLYKGPFHQGKRCVILCEGFYEWQTTENLKSSERPVFFIHCKQTEGEIDGKTSPFKLMKIAGLFDMWEDNTGERIYSYTVITFESNKLFSSIHHRMPAILETDKDVSDWLDFQRVTDTQALATLRPTEDIIWHQVSKYVNNSRNKSSECNKPITETKTDSPAPKNTEIKNKMMKNWLFVKKRKNEKDEEEETENSSAEKKHKN